MRPLESNGRVLSWTPARVDVDCMDEVMLGELVELEGAGAAIVVELLADRVVLAPLGGRPARVGSWAQRRGAFATAVDDSSIGHVVDVLGRVLDDPARPVSTRVAMPDEHPSHAVFFRDPVVLPHAHRRLTFGLPAIDLQRASDLGQSIAIRCDEHVLGHVLAHQVYAGRVVVDARVVTPARLVGKGHPHAPRYAPVPAGTIQVAIDESPAPAQHWLVPYAAMAIASGLRASGRDVVVVIDRVDEWRTYAKRFPLRGAWHTQLAQLASHAYATTTGSVTLLANVRDVTPTTIDALGTFVDLAAVARGIPISTSALVRPVVRVEPLQALGAFCAHAAWFASLEVSHGFAIDDPRTDRPTRQMILAGQRARTALQFRRGMTLDPLEQILCLHALARCKHVDTASIGRFFEAYLVALRDRCGAELAAVRAARRGSPAEIAALLACADPIADQIERSFS